MKCTSCEMEINPKWKHAIDLNVCPFCGKNIMEEHLKNLLSSLMDTMSKLQSYPDQLNDWMLSNFNFIKTDSENLINFLPKNMIRNSSSLDKNVNGNKFIVKVPAENGKVEEVEAEKIQSEDETNEFFQRAQVTKKNTGPGAFKSVAAKTQYLKELSDRIKKTGTISLDADGNEKVIDPEMMENIDPDAIEEYQSLMGTENINSALSPMPTGEDEIPAAILAMANNSKSSKGHNPKDLELLRRMQNRVNNSRENFESGANRGTGGFSRSG